MKVSLQFYYVEVFFRLKLIEIGRDVYINVYINIENKGSWYI